MKTETPPQPTIAELWGELQKAIPHGSFYAINAPKFDDPQFQQSALDVADRFRSLRQQLLERCKSEPSYLDAVFVNGIISYHKEMSAYHAFWAWELEQREREAKNEH